MRKNYRGEWKQIIFTLIFLQDLVCFQVSCHGNADKMSIKKVVSFSLLYHDTTSVLTETIHTAFTVAHNVLFYDWTHETMTGLHTCTHWTPYFSAEWTCWPGSAENNSPAPARLANLVPDYEIGKMSSWLVQYCFCLAGPKWLTDTYCSM